MYWRKITACMGLFLLLMVGTATGQTITVTISTDTVDIDWTNATIEDLPGPDGEISFSEALIAANHTPGHQTIGFAIPQSDWQLQFALPGRAVLTSITGYFFSSSDEVTIDGTTQSEFTGDTNPDGWEVAIYGHELYLSADNCTLIGFDSSAVSVGGAGCLVQGNTGTMNISLFGGGGSLIQGNQGGTIKIDRSSDNIVVGNTVNRVRVLGAIGLDAPAVNNRIGGPNLEDRNFIVGYGYRNSEGLPSGAAVQLSDNIGTLIQNNWIGTTPDGMAQGNDATTMGIRFEGENHDVTVLDNRIAGILGQGMGPHHAGQVFGWAIYLSGSGSNIDIFGNTIGLDANDEPLLGSVTGIDIGTWGIFDITDIQIGGANPGEGNVIAGHLFNGITVGNSVPQVRITGNSIFANQALGIDLIPSSYGYGVTPNDPLDADTGGNGLQNFPELETATQSGSSLHVAGMLHSYPTSEFTVEFFASPACHGTGHGEGKLYVGSTGVTTDEDGNGNYDVMLPATVDEGWILVATATREPDGATSEFSACVSITVDATAISESDVPVAAMLSRPWPNPANPRINVDLAIARTGIYRVRVLDIAGRAVANLFQGKAAAGMIRLTWDGNDAAGQPAASGLYLLELTGESVATRKFSLVR